MNKSANYSSIVIIVQEITQSTVKYNLAYGNKDQTFTWKTYNMEDRFLLNSLRVGAKYWISTKSDGRGVQHWSRAEEFNRTPKTQQVTKTAKVKVIPSDSHLVRY
jgi:hypothetical protein